MLENLLNACLSSHFIASDTIIDLFIKEPTKENYGSLMNIINDYALSI